MKRITLSEWNNKYFAKPRSPRQLSRYIKEGKLYPAPEKVGREYELEPWTVLTNDKMVREPQYLMEKINGQKQKCKEQGFTA
ncbi:excisionase [Proteus mirabilis]|uniref:excisionase n=1 Tax=Proteus mirabilis TaxID=584 RepID=UPI001ADC9877|nr:excisionase [Proteus mirabilis]MBO8262627.1 excisionase [Proteus mirabilis]MBO8266109.1 excisionase [Proteus mirabilis]MBO8270657.1 excisionase [Proteus mirabilis]MBO8274274.1 excisionase [Proteus mirabilis]MBO8277961.1 excisionase [Proteus mirabilis]